MHTIRDAIKFARTISGEGRVSFVPHKATIRSILHILSDDGILIRDELCFDSAFVDPTQACRYIAEEILQRKPSAKVKAKILRNDTHQFTVYADAAVYDTGEMRVLVESQANFCARRFAMLREYVLLYCMAVLDEDSSQKNSSQIVIDAMRSRKQKDPISPSTQISSEDFAQNVAMEVLLPFWKNEREKISDMYNFPPIPEAMKTQDRYRFDPFYSCSVIAEAYKIPKTVVAQFFANQYSMHSFYINKEIENESLTKK